MVDKRCPDGNIMDRWTTLYEFYDEAVTRANYRRDLKSNPFTEVHYRDQDDYKSGSLREKVYREYLVNQVRSKQGTTWENWIKKPLSVITWELGIMQEVTKAMAAQSPNGKKDKPGPEAESSKSD